ncbi:MAG: hypothetical protein DWQ40_00750 [Actinobacteria bacterium]|nr:MAG: hypothetical protein DWQ40_00750 [Actinomycetota bacterium]REK40867.1 MAG: hypothetical protein DWQ20_01020 [Actinomycetota bacterium]
MLLQITVPQAYAAFRGGELASWHVKEGDPLEFGTVICDISIDEIVGLRRTKRASLLGSTSLLRKRKVNDGLDHRQGRGAVLIRLTSAENGMVMRKRAVEEGQRVVVGSMVGLIGSPDAEIPDELPDTQARIAVDFPDPDDFDPFDE